VPEHESRTGDKRMMGRKFHRVESTTCQMAQTEQNPMSRELDAATKFILIDAIE
jgi:hypothetical protein